MEYTLKSARPLNLVANGIHCTLPFGTWQTHIHVSVLQSPRPGNRDTIKPTECCAVSAGRAFSTVLGTAEAWVVCLYMSQAVPLCFTQRTPNHPEQKLLRAALWTAIIILGMPEQIGHVPTDLCLWTEEAQGMLGVLSLYLESTFLQVQGKPAQHLMGGRNDIFCWQGVQKEDDSWPHPCD